MNKLEILFYSIVMKDQLTDEQVMSIFELSGTETDTDIAKKFNIGRKAVSYIRTGMTFSHLTGLPKKNP